MTVRSGRGSDRSLTTPDPPLFGALGQPERYCQINSERGEAVTELVALGDEHGPRCFRRSPDVDEAEEAMLAIAAQRVNEAWFAVWLRERIGLP